MRTGLLQRYQIKKERLKLEKNIYECVSLFISVVAVTETELSVWQRPSLRVECFFLPLVCVQSDHTTAVLSQAGRQAGRGAERLLLLQEIAKAVM